MNGLCPGQPLHPLKFAEDIKDSTKRTNSE